MRWGEWYSAESEAEDLSDTRTIVCVVGSTLLSVLVVVEVVAVFGEVVVGMSTTR